MNTKRYTFGYFYPSSLNARFFKMPKGGYHVSEFAKNGITLNPLFAFKTEEEAKNKLKSLYDEAKHILDRTKLEAFKAEYSFVLQTAPHDMRRIHVILDKIYTIERKLNHSNKPI